MKQEIKKPIRAIMMLATALIVVAVLFVASLFICGNALGATAYPVIMSVNNGSNANAANVTVNFPSGYVAGDLLITTITTYNGTGVPTVTPPAGWTTLYTASYISSYGSSAYYKVAAGTEGTSTNFTLSGNTSYSYCIERIQTGTYTGVPVAGTAVNGVSYPDPPPLTSGFGITSTLWLTSVSCANSQVSYSTGFALSSSGGTSNYYTYVSYKNENAASKDPDSWSTTGAYIANTIAVQGYGVALGTNPTIIQWGNTSPASQYQVFYNVLQTGDWLIIGESYIQTTDTNPSTNAFSFSLLNVGGTSVLRSTPLWSYGDRPTSIYITAADVTSLGLSVGGAYVIKLAGNPTLFTTSGNNTIQTTLTNSNYSDQSTATDTLNPLKSFCVQIGQHMQTTDAVSTYMVSVSGSWYVTNTGSSLFLLGIPSLDIMCPTLFQTIVVPMSVPTGTSNMSYGENISVSNILGVNANTGITNLASWFGLPNNAGARALILLGMGAILLFIISRKIQDRTMLLIIGVLFFAFAVWIGIGSWAIMIIIAIIVSILMLYYLWSRGIL